MEGSCVLSVTIDEILDSAEGVFLRTTTPLRLQIRAPAGIGKTSALIKSMGERFMWKGLITDFYVPNYDLAQEVLNLCRKARLPSRIFKGRAARDMCAKADSAKLAANLDLNIYETLCKRTDKDGRELVCEHYASCPYIEQWKDQEPGVRIFVHQYLGLHRPQPDGVSLPPANLVVIDESAFMALTRHESFDLELLDGPAAEAVKESIQRETDLATILRAKGVTADQARAQAHKLEKEIETSVSPEMNNEEAFLELTRSKHSTNRKLAHFYRQVAAEIELGRPFHGIEVSANESVSSNGQVVQKDRINIHWSEQPQVNQSTPLLIIDADADIEINRRFFGQDLQEVAIRVGRNAHVTQCCSTRLGKSTLLGSDPGKNPVEKKPVSKVRKIVKQEVATGAKALVVASRAFRVFVTQGVGHKDYSKLKPIERSEPWLGATITHFGRIRGSDEWKDFDTVIIVGREEPNAATMEREARAIWAEDPIPLKLLGTDRYPEQHLGYRLANGNKVGVKTTVHPDSRVQKLLELARERELEQAIDRLRLVHNQKPKRVIILCNIPIDITVDELLTLDELAETPGRAGPRQKIQLVMDRLGVVPLGHRDLARICSTDPFGDFPSVSSLFPSESAAREILKQARNDPRAGTENGGQYQIEYIFGNDPHYRVATYRRDGQRGRKSRVVYDPARVQNPIGVLSILLGEIVSELTDETVDDLPPGTATIDLDTGEIIYAQAPPPNLAAPA